MPASATLVDVLIDHIGQLCVIPAHNGGPQRGARLGDLAPVENAALAIHMGRIAAAGPRDAIMRAFTGRDYIDAGGRLATPGLIDPHTHLVWAGDRAGEFEQRLQGKTYMDIAAAGGGINHTVRLTRAASRDELAAQARPRLDRMLRCGATTVEVKTGYGLATEAEIAMLDAIADLNASHPLDLVPTFLGGHDIPPEYAGRADAYVDLLVDEMIPAVAAWKAQRWPGPLYCDAFCEKGVFDVAQTRRILEAGARAGLTPRLHADEFVSLGGVALATELNAASVDHLLATTPEDVARLAGSRTVAVLLPATPFGLGIPNTAPARALIEAGAALALATDCNPGTAWCESMPFILALATRALKLTPAQALAAATINAAFAVERGDRIGSLEPGKMADVALWDAPDYRHLSYRFGANLAHTVIKGGQVVWRAG